MTRERAESLRVELAIRLAHREGKPETWRDCLVAIARALDVALGPVEAIPDEVE